MGNVSLKPSALVEGMTLINDEDVAITEARFCMFDYQGKMAAVPAVRFKMDRGEGDTTDQYYTLGKASDWVPSEDGKHLIPIGRATGLVNSSNWAMFLVSLVNAGFPENRIEDDITVLEGLEAHVIRVPTQRIGLKKSDSQKEDTVLIVNKIHVLPWEKKPNVSLGDSQASPKRSKKPKEEKSEERESVEDKAVSFVMDTLAGYPDGIEKSKLPQLAFAQLKSDPSRNAIVKLVFDDTFLSSQPLWKFEGGRVTTI